MKKILLIILLILCFDNLKSEEKTFTHQVNAKAGLRLRDTPSTNGKQIALIPYGEYVTMIDELQESVKIGDVIGKWIRLNWNGTEGYAFGGFLTKINNIKFITIPSEYILDVPMGLRTLIFLTDQSHFYFQEIAFDADDIDSQYKTNSKTYGTYTIEIKNDQVYINFAACEFIFTYHYVDPKNKYKLSDFEKSHFDEYSRMSGIKDLKILIKDITLLLSGTKSISNNHKSCGKTNNPDYYLEYGLGNIFDNSFPNNDKKISVPVK